MASNQSQEQVNNEQATPAPTSRNTVFRPPPSPNKFAMSLDDMIQVAFDLGSGMSARQTASKHHRSPTTVGNVRKRALGFAGETVQIDIMTAFLSHFVTFCLLVNPLATGEGISELAQSVGLFTSKTSVNRIAQNLKFRSIIAQKTEPLSQRHKEYRTYFSENIFTWVGFHLPWVFTDETMLVLNPTRKRIRVIRGVETDEKYVATSGYPVKVMVWGAISRDFKSPLIRIEGKVTADAYQNILKSSQIFEKLRQHFGERAFVFQQDGARPHTATSTRQFLDENVLTLPQDLHWPASSPDLSVIENLWSMLKYRINYEEAMNGDSLYREAERVWSEISLEVINNCLDDFEPRLRACAALHGECLNEHKAVLRAFRRSSLEGMQELEKSRRKKDCVRQFCDASQTFFHQRLKAFTPQLRRQKLRQGMIITEIERQNLQILSESCQICDILPAGIRSKTGLPVISDTKRDLVKMAIESS